MKKQQQQIEDLGEVDLNQNGRPKQAVILYELTPQMIESAKEKIDKDNEMLPHERYVQAREKAAKVWDVFYSNHKCNFFKDRNYLEREIKEIKYFREKHEESKQNFTYLELGCGVGNTLFPLLREYCFFTFQGCDISAQAIKLIEKQMEEHPQYKERLEVKVCDLVKNQIEFKNKPDLLSMIFVLSAIVPEKHQDVINKVAKWMKPGSCFFFRDYGRYDFGQVNMSNKGNRKLTDNFYVKNDGVCVYYFEQEELEKLFENAGLIKVQGSIHCRLLQNRKTGLKMYRIWVQGRFYKPPIDPFFLERIQKQKKEEEEKRKQRQNEQAKQDKKQDIKKEDIKKEEGPSNEKPESAEKQGKEDGEPKQLKQPQKKEQSEQKVQNNQSG